MKKRIAVGLISAVVVVAIVVLIIFLVNWLGAKKNVKDILNKEITMAKGILYCDGIDNKSLEDDFSKVYSQAVKINVESIDETAMVAKVTIVAPPLKEILKSQLPETVSGDYNTVFSSYMSNVYKAVKECPEENKVSTTVDCKVVDNNGLKLVPDNEFLNALFPDVSQLLSELMSDALGTMEG